MIKYIVEVEDTKTWRFTFTDEDIEEGDDPETAAFELAEYYGTDMTNINVDVQWEDSHVEILETELVYA